MHYALNGKYPIETKEHIKTAMDYFSKYISRFNHDDRVTFSCNIEKRATDLGVVVDNGLIHNYTRVMSKHASLSPDFKRNMDKRRHICKSSNRMIKTASGRVSAVEVLDKLAALAENVPVIALIKTIEEFDKKAGLVFEYDKTILDPVMTVCGSLVNPKYDAVKVAGDITDYDVVDISKNHEQLEKLASVFPSDVVENFKKNPIETVISFNDMEKDLFSKTVA